MGRTAAFQSQWGGNIQYARIGSGASTYLQVSNDPSSVVFDLLVAGDQRFTSQDVVSLLVRRELHCQHDALGDVAIQDHSLFESEDLSKRPHAHGRQQIDGCQARFQDIVFQLSLALGALVVSVCQEESSQLLYIVLNR